MGWMKSSSSRWWVVLAILAWCGAARSAAALYLDDDQNINLRARIYSQATVRIEDSSVGTVPTTKAGQLVQHRNFFNPELEAKLVSYTKWMKGTWLDGIAPDDLSMRVAGWGFYDGIYDYGSSQFNDTARLINSTYPNLDARPQRAWFLEGARYNPYATTVDEMFPKSNDQNPRDIYGTRRRVNELYLNYTKGPVFIRIGRQAISWGESDTIALLDQNNPFDVTLGAPGVFQDLDEARIPLWTLRGSYNLFDYLGPLSSGFIEAYWVPGDLDVNTGILPVLTSNPYAPRGDDPQKSVPARAKIGDLEANIRNPPQFVLLDRIPRKRFENSRWGVRLQTVVNRTHTASVWYYTHFPNAPVPRNAGITHEGKVVLTADSLLRDCQLGIANSPERCIYTTETVHRMTGVLGISDSFFFEPLDGIVRAEMEYFIGEPSFIPEQNLSIKQGGGFFDPLIDPGTVPRADYLRWELGFDRFFFARFLNPANSFTLVSAFVGSWNLDETSVKDFRMPIQKISYLAQPPGTVPVPNDFVQQKKVEMFMQTHLQSDYLHGRLTPGITYIQNVRGTYAVIPDLIYRWRDWMLFNVNAVIIGGEYQQLGFFRDRDQIWFKMTYQLN